MIVNIKKIDRVSPGFDRVPGRPGGSTRFPRANSQTGFCLHPDRSQALVGRVPGRPAGPVRVLKLWFQHLWLAKLLGFDYEIKHRKGKKNVGVDTLSRFLVVKFIFW